MSQTPRSNKNEVAQPMQQLGNGEIALGLEVQLEEFARQAEGAFSPNTERAYASDTKLFTAWCSARGYAPFPAYPETVAAFIDAQSELGRAPASLSRYVSSISKMHAAAGLTGSDNPCTTAAVKMALRRVRRQRGTRQQQREPLALREVNGILELLGDSLRDLRDGALLSVAYDTMARRAELVMIRLEDIERSGKGDGTVLVRRAKTDQEGAGKAKYLSRTSMTWIDRWIAAAGLGEGPLFHTVDRNGRVRGPLAYESPDAGYEVGRIFKRLAVLGGIEPSKIGGHSTRVGMCQDLVAGGASLTGVMEAGDWKSPRMPARYSERLLASRGAVAELAKKLGR